ncbi:hypothetical protein H0H92_002642 [Tricholoma furcatifolium]|nr:hypothetical protein H0H92_002642 [Tricholoma furcatifolium]
MGIIIDLGGNPEHDRIGFRYWRAPDGPMGTYLLSQVHNKHLAIFLGFWSTLTNALFAYIGTELIGVTVGEAENPRRNIPIAIRRTFFRILVFYVGGVFVIGLVVPSTNNSLFLATKSKTGAAASPFVVATTLVGIKVLNHIINAAILIFVMSAANSDLYIASRTLYGLAIEGKAPAIFKKVNRLGVPWPSLIVCTLFCGLVFLNVESSSAKAFRNAHKSEVFTWFVNLVSTAGAITWMCIAFCHIRFMKALKVHGLDRQNLPYKAPLQPWGSWFALIATAIITVFKGFDTFIPFTVDTFVTKATDRRRGGKVPDSPGGDWTKDCLAKALGFFIIITVMDCYICVPSVLCHQISRRAMSSVSRSVTKKVLAVETPEGAGALVRRSIGSMGLRNLTPFLMLDHFHVSQGAGFPDHPHRGQATVTYMLEGSSRHEDSAGHKGTIETGGVQWMCAGKGIIHAEMPVHAEGAPDPRGLQLWVDLPKEDPSYQELGPEQIPTAYPNGKDGPVRIKVISGKSHGVESPVRPLGGCWFFHVIFNQKSSIFQDIPPTWTAFLYTLKGALTIGSDTTSHGPFHTLVFSDLANETGVSISATEDNTEVILVAGEPLDQTVFQYGPFVMTNREEIQKTIIDYQTGRNGFEKAHTWKSKIAHE